MNINTQRTFHRLTGQRELETIIVYGIHVCVTKYCKEILITIGFNENATVPMQLIITVIQY